MSRDTVDGVFFVHRCDVATLRVEIQNRSADRITSGEVMRLFEMHRRAHEKEPSTP